MLPSKSSLILLRVLKDSSLFHHFSTDASFALFLSLCTTRLTNFVEISQSSQLQRVPQAPVALSLRGMRASSALPCCDRVVTCPVPSFPSSVYSRVPKKSSQELYGLICYAELRKKVGGCKQTAKRTNACCSFFFFFLQFVGVLSLHLTLRHKGLIAA